MGGREAVGAMAASCLTALSCSRFRRARTSSVCRDVAHWN